MAVTPFNLTFRLLKNKELLFYFSNNPTLPNESTNMFNFYFKAVMSLHAYT